MGFITTRTTGRGTSYRVQWRHAGAQHVRTFATRPDAERWLVRLEALGHDEALALLAGPPPDPNVPTVGKIVADHIAGLTGVTDGTRRRYEKIAANHIAPDLGDLPLDLLTHQRAAAWVNGLQREGLSGKTIKNVHSLLSGSLTSAVRDRHVPENVVRGLRLPKSVRDEMVFLSRAEVQEFIVLTPERWRPLVALLFASGMRFGESTALAVRDVDLDGGTIRIRQAWKATSGAGYQLGPPKSERSRRTISIPDGLERMMVTLTHRRSADEFVFLNSQGGPVRHASFHSHVWTPTVHEFAGDTRHATGIGGRRRWTWDDDGEGKRPRVHDARHTYAALAVASGKSLLQLQRHMGHESIRTTGDVYGHLFDADREAMGSVVDLGATLMGHHAIDV